VAEAQHFRDLTVGDFAERLASSEPVPGGGSASAIAAALGGSLVAMVAALSEGRPKYAEHEAMYGPTGAAGRALRDRLLALADEDAAAYGAFAAARKLPRETDAEREVRATAMRVAARAAAEAPLRCVEACRDVVAAAEALAGRSNVNASSDVAVAALLGEAGARGAAANVLINLPSVGDDPWAATTSARVEALLAETERLARSAREVVASGEPRPPLAAGEARPPLAARAG